MNIQQFGDESTLSCLCEPQAVAIQSCVVDWRRDGKTIVDDQTSVKVVDYVSGNYLSMLSLFINELSSIFSVLFCYQREIRFNLPINTKDNRHVTPKMS